MINNVESRYGNVGWVSQLLKRLGRNNFTNKLEENGYECVYILDKDGEISEYLVWDINKI